MLECCVTQKPKKKKLHNTKREGLKKAAWYADIDTNSTLKNNWFFISSKSTSKIANTVSTADTAKVNRIHNNVMRRDEFQTVN